jgi:hypothetical protein
VVMVGSVAVTVPPRAGLGLLGPALPAGK